MTTCRTTLLSTYTNGNDNDGRDPPPELPPISWVLPQDGFGGHVHLVRYRAVLTERLSQQEPNQDSGGLFVAHGPIQAKRTPSDSGNRNRLRWRMELETLEGSQRELCAGGAFRELSRGAQEDVRGGLNATCFGQ